jgi:hypothetical protein
MSGATPEEYRSVLVRPILHDLTERLPSFSIFKHADGALDGSSDADCSLLPSELDRATGIIATHPSIPRPAWLLQCDHLFEARLHFLFVPWGSTHWLPIEIDLKYLPSTRFGLPWADPSVIAKLSVRGEHGVRKLAPGPEVLLEVFNYGTVSPEAARRIARRMAPVAPPEPFPDSLLLLPASMQAAALRSDIPRLVVAASVSELERCALLLRQLALRRVALRPHRVAISISRRMRGQRAPRCRTASLATSGHKLAPIDDVALEQLAVTDQLTRMA